MADQLSAADVQTLLDGIDATFWRVLHGRYGGAIELAVQAGGDDQAVQMLRVGADDSLRLILEKSGGPPANAQGGSALIGTTRLSGPPSPSVDDVTVITEIFETRDPNEAADASFLRSGVLFAAASAGSPGGLEVVRSSEAASQAGQASQQRQRGWLPSRARQNPGRALGLTTNGHRRAPTAGIVLPVSADLLTRIGDIVARLGGDGAASFHAMALAVRIGQGGLG